MIGAVITDYARPDLAIRSINSFLKTTKDVNVRLVVVDLGKIKDIPRNRPLNDFNIEANMERNTKRYADLVAKGDIHCVISIDRNMGKSYCCNIGATMLREECKCEGMSAPDYYLFADNDMLYRDGWLKLGLEMYNKYRDTFPIMSFHNNGAPDHQPIRYINDKAVAPFRLSANPSTPGFVYLMDEEFFKQIGKFPTKKQMGDDDYHVIHVVQGLKKEFLLLEGVAEHIGFGRSAWRLEKSSWDCHDRYNKELKKQYGPIEE